MSLGLNNFSFLYTFQTSDSTFEDFSWLGSSLSLIISALWVIFTTNSVIAVFYMVISFLSGAALISLVGADFLALTYIIVYMGAIVVLFLFVVMMLRIQPVTLRLFLVYSPIALVVGIVLLLQLASGLHFSIWGLDKNNFFDLSYLVSGSINIEILGQQLYSYYFLFFLVAGLILLVALVGAILLTIANRPAVKIGSTAVVLQNSNVLHSETIKLKCLA